MKVGLPCTYTVKPVLRGHLCEMCPYKTDDPLKDVQFI